MNTTARRIAFTIYATAVFLLGRWPWLMLLLVFGPGQLPQIYANWIKRPLQICRGTYQRPPRQWVLGGTSPRLMPACGRPEA